MHIAVDETHRDPIRRLSRRSAFETGPVPATSNEDAATSSYARPFAVTLDFSSGTLTPAGGMFVRRLSDMATLYEDQEAVSRALGIRR